MRLAIISDTHGHKIPDMPEADVLVHCGDWSGHGTEKETRGFFIWLKDIAHKYQHIVLTPGNHDRYIEKEPQFAKEMLKELVPKAHLLINEELVLDGVKFYGQPFTPAFGHWAFMGDMERLMHLCQAIPDDVDVLLSHGPPLGTLDHVERYHMAEYSLENVGCYELKVAMERIRPKIHCFGHLHLDGGKQEQKGSTLFINAANVNESYKVVNRPVELEI